MNPAQWLFDTASKHPERPALYAGSNLICDYAGFCKRAASIGQVLKRQYGVGKGDRVAVYAVNSTEYLETLYGIWFVGATAVPINAKLHANEVRWILEDAGARLCFVSPGLLPGLQNTLSPTKCQLIENQSQTYREMRDSQMLVEPAKLSDDDMIWLFYTSGTTGKPKGVMITCANIQAMVNAYFESVDTVRNSDTIFYAAPISHGAGIYNFQHVIKGAHHAIPESGGFDPKEIFLAGRIFGNIHMFAAPTMIRRLVQAAKVNGETGEGIRTIVYGGGPMYQADIVEAVDVLGDRFCQIYGQGESPMCITALSREDVSDRAHSRWKERLQSVGKAQFGVKVAISDADGNHLGPDEIGEILVKGPSVMKGYWQNPEANDAALRDGWLWTGDMGSLDEDGYLTLKDRSKDLIISGGSNVYPREVEEALLNHPDVIESSVIGQKDPDWGEIVIAFVCCSLGSELDETKLDAHCLEQIARFKRPKKYYFLDELPKNNYGKVLKTDLRKWLEQ